MNKSVVAALSLCLLSIGTALADPPSEQEVADEFRMKTEITSLQESFEPSGRSGDTNEATTMVSRALALLTENFGTEMNQGKPLPKIKEALLQFVEHPIGPPILKDMIRHALPIEQRVEAIRALKLIGDHPIVANVLAGAPRSHAIVIEAIADVWRSAHQEAYLRGLTRRIAEVAIQEAKDSSTEFGNSVVRILAVGGIEAQEALLYTLTQLDPTNGEAVRQVGKALGELALDPELFHKVYEGWRSQRDVNEVPKEKAAAYAAIDRVFYNLALGVGERARLVDLIETFERSEQTEVQRQVLEQISRRPPKEHHLVENFVRDQLSKTYIRTQDIGARIVRILKRVRPQQPATLDLMRNLASPAKDFEASSETRAAAIDVLMDLKLFMENPQLLAQVVKDPRLQADEIIDVFNRRMQAAVANSSESTNAIVLWSMLLEHPNAEVRTAALEAGKGQFKDSMVWEALKRIRRLGLKDEIKMVEFKNGFTLPSLKVDFSPPEMFKPDAAAFSRLTESDTKALTIADRRGEIKSAQEEREIKKQLSLLPEESRKTVRERVVNGEAIREAIKWVARK